MLDLTRVSCRMVSSIERRARSVLFAQQLSAKLPCHVTSQPTHACLSHTSAATPLAPRIVWRWQSATAGSVCLRPDPTSSQASKLPYYPHARQMLRWRRVVLPRTWLLSILDCAGLAKDKSPQALLGGMAGGSNPCGETME